MLLTPSITSTAPHKLNSISPKTGVPERHSKPNLGHSRDGHTFCDNLTVEFPILQHAFHDIPLQLKADLTKHMSTGQAVCDRFYNACDGQFGPLSDAFSLDVVHSSASVLIWNPASDSSHDGAAAAVRIP